MMCLCGITPLSFFFAVLLLAWLGKHGFFDTNSPETEAN